VTITDDPPQEKIGSQPARPRRAVIIAASVAAVGVGAAVYVGGWTSLMGVQAVEVQGRITTPAAQLVETANIEMGTPMMRVDVKAATARLADLPQVASVDVRRQWPRTVVLSVTERQAVATRATDAGWELVDANGVPFAVTGKKTKGLPEVEAAADGAVTTAIVQVLAGLPDDVRSKVSSVSANSPDSIRLVLRKDRGEVNWGSAQDSDYKGRVLVVLLQTKAGWYDVSDPNTPTTADGAPTPSQEAAQEAAQQAEVTPTASPRPSPSQTATPPATAESAVGVIPAD
jgi:cell division protein FtsQ